MLDILRKPAIEAWRSRVGETEADALLTKAQEKGTRVHKACEDYLDGKEYSDILFESTKSPEEAMMLDGFINWFTKNNIELVESELFLISDDYKYAGRCDLICMIDGELWIIDIKTGSDHAKAHSLQLKFYQQAYLEMTGRECRMGILRLNPKTKQGYSKVKEYHGKKMDILTHLAVYNYWAEDFIPEAPVDGSKIWKN